MRNDEDVRFQHISVEDINLVIKKMVPYDSPLAERVQALVFDLISLSPKYLLDMQEFASSADPILLSDEDCQAIIAMVKTNKNTETCEPPRDCRRPKILREYDNEKTNLHP